jgi:signal peptidase II
VKSVWFYVTALVILIADQITKEAVMGAIPYGQSVPVLGSLLSLTPTHNTGGAFSLFQAKNHYFVLVASLAVIALLVTYHRFQRRDFWASAALMMAFGGAIGNLIDRVRFGYVRDFFDIHVWPIFNIADSAITLGILILAWHFLFKRPAATVRVEEGEGRKGEEAAG